MRLDKVLTYSRRLVLATGVGILFLLCFIILTAQAVLPIPTVKTQLVPSLSCPDAPPLNTQSGATLTFCSPTNQGYVGGPYGTHIVLVGENFPGGSIKWFYQQQTPNQQNSYLNTNAAKVCLNGNGSCSLSPIASSQAKLIQGEILFGWTWNATASFPNKKADYSLIAIINSSQGPVTVVSSVAFSLLSTQAPCIIVDDGSSIMPTDCSQSQELQLTPSTSSQSLTLKGTNWLLQGLNNADVGANVTITVSCDPAVPCTHKQISQLMATADLNGKFSKKLSLPANIFGTFDICVDSRSSTVATPITSSQNVDTVVNNALTYGCTPEGDSQELTITY